MVLTGVHRGPHQAFLNFIEMWGNTRITEHRGIIYIIYIMLASFILWGRGTVPPTRPQKKTGGGGGVGGG